MNDQGTALKVFNGKRRRYLNSFYIPICSQFYKLSNTRENVFFLGKRLIIKISSTNLEGISEQFNVILIHIFNNLYSFIIVVFSIMKSWN